MSIKMTIQNYNSLSWLEECGQESGIALKACERRKFAHLVSAGCVEWYEAAGIRFYSITEMGRDQLAQIEAVMDGIG